jgi:hypothetical protein
MADRVVRNGIGDGLAVSVAFKSMACPDVVMLCPSAASIISPRCFLPY